MFNVKNLGLVLLLFITFSVFSLDKSEQDIAGFKSGSYDYLFYGVTWQPTFCILNEKDAGCKKYRPDFYTYGIWPYFKTAFQTANKHPSNCVASPGCTENGACDLNKETLASMLDNQYLFKVFYLIKKDGSSFNQDKELQIGERCSEPQIIIPDVAKEIL